MQQRFDVRNRDGAVDTSFFEQLKFHYKLPETTQKICEHLFVFLTRSIGVGKGRGGRDPPNWNFNNDKNVTNSLLFLQFLFSIFRWQQDN